MGDLDVVEIYKGRKLVSGRTQWRWRYKAAGNHKILANGGESYGNLGDLVESLGRVLNLAYAIKVNEGHQRIRRNSDWHEVLVVIHR